MKVVPKSEEEVMKSGLLEKGVYPFQVIKAEDTISEKGNPMMKLILRVWDTNGREHVVYDNLVDKMEFKVRHFAYSVGLGDQYEAGEIEDVNCVNRQGTCKIYIQEDKKGVFPPKNAVVDYIVEDSAKSESNKNGGTAAPIFDDELPF